jgi:hypothetical protein
MGFEERKRQGTQGIRQIVADLARYDALVPWVDACSRRTGVRIGLEPGCCNAR